jgi:hypothetical protein
MPKGTLSTRLVSRNNHCKREKVGTPPVLEKRRDDRKERNRETERQLILNDEVISRLDR